MLAIYLHYEDANQETKILQRSMMRHDVSYYDLILMIEEVGFQEIDFLPYFVHMYDQSHVMKMLCDPKIVKDVHLYVSKEKAGDDVSPPSKKFDIALSNHPNESVLLREGGVYAEGEGTGQLTMKRPQSIPLEPYLLHICIDYYNCCNKMREMRDPTGESFSRQNQQGTRTVYPHPARSRKSHTSTIKAGSKVVLKSSTYPSKRNVAYGTIRSTNQRTKACGIELGAEFALMRIDQPLLHNEELVREVFDCMTVGEAFSTGYLIAWPPAFIREKDN
ncbi:hypothetical protein ZWY2020_020971 [Hordeum vulgare]|nr:hypothetical protein ZWY2020_020971 [Hordeum vulgare]